MAKKKGKRTAEEKKAEKTRVLQQYVKTVSKHTTCYVSAKVAQLRPHQPTVRHTPRNSYLSRAH